MARLRLLCLAWLVLSAVVLAQSGEGDDDIDELKEEEDDKFERQVEGKHDDGEGDDHPSNEDEGASTVDDDFRPPGGEGDDEDLGVVQTMGAQPTDEEMKKMEQMAAEDDAAEDESPFTPSSKIGHVHAHSHHTHVIDDQTLVQLHQQVSQHSHDHSETGSGAHHTHQQPSMFDKPSYSKHPATPHSSHHSHSSSHSSSSSDDDDEEQGGSGQSGFDSRATAAWKTANNAITKAKRAAEEARLAIKAAEAAKREAEEVAKRGGDGGPATDEQQLFEIQAEEANGFKDGQDAADLGLPNPNPPIMKGENYPPPPMVGDEELGVSNMAQLSLQVGKGRPTGHSFGRGGSSMMPFGRDGPPGMPDGAVPHMPKGMEMHMPPGLQARDMRKMAAMGMEGFPGEPKHHEQSDNYYENEGDDTPDWSKHKHHHHHSNTPKKKKLNMYGDSSED